LPFPKKGPPNAVAVAATAAAITAAAYVILVVSVDVTQTRVI